MAAQQAAERRVLHRRQSSAGTLDSLVLVKKEPPHATDDLNLQDVMMDLHIPSASDEVDGKLRINQPETNLSARYVRITPALAVPVWELSHG